MIHFVIAAAIQCLLLATVVLEWRLIAKTIRTGDRKKAVIVDFSASVDATPVTPILEFARNDGAPLRMPTRFGSGAYTPMKGVEVAAIYVAGAHFALIDTWRGRWDRCWFSRSFTSYLCWPPSVVPMAILYKP